MSATCAALKWPCFGSISI